MIYIYKLLLYYILIIYNKYLGYSIDDLFIYCPYSTYSPVR